jgi:hypothetical protein
MAYLTFAIERVSLSPYRQDYPHIWTGFPRLEEGEGPGVCFPDRSLVYFFVVLCLITMFLILTLCSVTNCLLNFVCQLRININDFICIFIE